MKTIFGTLTDRLLSWIGLDFEFPIAMRGDAFNQITKHIYVGARPTPEDVPHLKAAGITHVISCLREEDRTKMAFLQQDCFALFLPIRDVIQQDIAPHFQTCVDFVTQAQKDNPQAKVLIHCEVGVSRSATLAIACIMMTETTGFLDTYLRTRAKRPGVLPNIGFASQLQRLEHKLLSNADDAPSSLARYLKEICNAPVELEVLQESLERHQYDARQAIQSIFGDIPRVIQGVR